MRPWPSACDDRTCPLNAPARCALVPPWKPCKPALDIEVFLLPHRFDEPGHSMEVVEKLRGRGRILDSTTVLESDVPYQITVWRQGGQTSFDGRLDVSFASAVTFMGNAFSLLLEIEDGRIFRFRMTSTT